MLVGDVMLEATTIEIDESIADAAQKMRENGAGCLVVLNLGTAIGTINERDVALGCPVDGHIPWECHVFRHMNIQTETAHPNMDTGAATIIMIESDTDCLPVVEDGKIVGIVYGDEISRANDREFSYESEFTSMIGAE